MLVKDRIAELVGQAIDRARADGVLAVADHPEVVIERPQNPEHGDYATSLPLRLARSLRMNPLVIAQKLAPLLPPADELLSATPAPPGFINFRLSPAWIKRQVDEVLRQGVRFGDVDVGKGEKVQVEFVSVNPTGPVHVGHGRGAVLGSTLANALEAAGCAVTREYYVNDAGTQVRNFAKSLHARYCQALGMQVEMPADGYMGAYMVDLAKEVVAKHGERFLKLPEEQAVAELSKLALPLMLDAIRTDLEMIRVTFDVWFSEQSLFDKGIYEKAMGLLRKGGHLAEREGALWLTSSSLGDDKDNVLVRSTGAPTYFASDIAYHYNKFVERGYQRVIDIWGADHQGHVPRMHAAVSALGIDPKRLKIMISQLVTLKRGEDVVRVSKRSGDLVTLREVAEEVGPDAARFFFLSRSADAQMDFDLELAKKQSAENPVYYVQYAHARIASILRLAQERGLAFDDGDVSLLDHEAELALIRKMLQLPELVETVALTLEPHHLPHYAQDLATHFHAFYKHCRVISQDEALTKARLKLVLAAKTTLARTLTLMGMNAPEQM